MNQLIYTTAMLRAGGLGSRAIARAVADGRLIALRRGRYALPGTPDALLTAARVGGRLSCVSALHHLGAWVVMPERPHVRVSRGIAAGAGARIHWTDERLGEAALDDAEAALRVAIRCLSFREAVIAVDSLANRRILTWATIEAICRSVPRGARIIAAADPRAESGIETIVRLTLRSMGVRVRSQVEIPDVGRVDLLVGDRLVIEVDGREFHSDFERDRARDRALLVAGYRVVRVSYRQVMDELPGLKVQLQALIRRGEHLQRPLDMR
jgi:very-short-patch-repair endonuclease